MDLLRWFLFDLKVGIPCGSLHCYVKGIVKVARNGEYIKEKGEESYDAIGFIYNCEP